MTGAERAKAMDGGDVIVFFTASLDLMQAAVFLMMASWLSYVIWLNREPGYFWRNFFYAPSDRLALGAVIMALGATISACARFVRVSYIYTLQHQFGFTPGQAVDSGLASVFVYSQLVVVFGSVFAWLGLFMWLIMPLKKLMGRGAYLLIVVGPVVLYMLTTWFFIQSEIWFASMMPVAVTP